MNDLSTGFIAKLRARDGAAWFELWEIFGPILRSQFSRWGRGQIGAETIQDLSQETMAALSTAIDRHDPSKGARFSTWLLSIARYTLGDELDRRFAQKRGGGVRAVPLGDGFAGETGGLGPDSSYEVVVFDAKVEAAIRAVERNSDFLDFEVFRQRVLDGRTGREVGQALGISEPTVSRRLSNVRHAIKLALSEVIARYSFTTEELQEAESNGLSLSPRNRDESNFDSALSDIYHRICERQSRS